MFRKQDSEYQSIDKMINRRIQQTVNAQARLGKSAFSFVANYGSGAGNTGGGFGGNSGAPTSTVKVEAWIGSDLTEAIAEKLTPQGMVWMVQVPSSDEYNIRAEVINDPSHWLGI